MPCTGIAVAVDVDVDGRNGEKAEGYKGEVGGIVVIVLERTKSDVLFSRH